MKKPLTSILSLLLVVSVGFVAYTVAPFLKDPQFEVINQSKHVVHVFAYWRNKNRELGAIQPSTTYVFSVNDEAAMKFTGRFPDGREINSEEIYFTSGTGVVATITEKGIQVKYDHET